MPISQPIKLHARQIFSRGQQLDNNALAFTAIGDSTIAGGQFLSRFGKGDYKLGEYAYLQDVIDAFAPSFTRQSTAIRIGLHSWSVMNPAWADKSKCKPNETVIACEFRLHKPSIVFIRLGANDVAARLFDRSMRKIVEYSIESGVIPVEITTFEGVTGVRIEGMACARVGQSDRVKCEGRIVADYGTETNEFLLTTYRVKQEDGEWKWCGESD